MDNRTATHHRSLSAKLQALRAIDAELPVVVIVHDMQTNTVEYMSPRGLEELGVTMEALNRMGPEYHNTFFNPQDVAEYLPKIMELVTTKDENDKIVSFFQQVRPSPSHDWRWYLSTTRVFMRNEAGEPTHVITCAAPIDPLHHVTSKVNRLLAENNFLRRNQHVFAALTKREKEILRLMALGISSAEMAAQLHISEKTAVTHRRNVKAKIGAQSTYDLTRFAQAFDLI